MDCCGFVVQQIHHRFSGHFWRPEELLGVTVMVVWSSQYWVKLCRLKPKPGRNYISFLTSFSGERLAETPSFTNVLPGTREFHVGTLPRAAVMWRMHTDNSDSLNPAIISPSTAPVSIAIAVLHRTFWYLLVLVYGQIVSLLRKQFQLSKPGNNFTKVSTAISLSQVYDSPLPKLLFRRLYKSAF